MLFFNFSVKFRELKVPSTALSKLEKSILSLEHCHGDRKNDSEIVGWNDKES